MYLSPYDRVAMHFSSACNVVYTDRNTRCSEGSFSLDVSIQYTGDVVIMSRKLIRVGHILPTALGRCLSLGSETERPQETLEYQTLNNVPGMSSRTAHCPGRPHRPSEDGGGGWGEGAGTRVQCSL
ncbi:hypothetical protein RRG08_028964 [Elysia crispata]|uniref:Uncharacterized protein n=1 Tax=Elysia crispata TaxID=231223 RepID=A0AAE1AR75_9GAST|nr:hypothetical protein RRG08_028964 [Elysia crispata]